MSRKSILGTISAASVAIGTTTTLLTYSNLMYFEKLEEASGVNDLEKLVDSLPRLVKSFNEASGVDEKLKYAGLYEEKTKQIAGVAADTSFQKWTTANTSHYPLYNGIGFGASIAGTGIALAGLGVALFSGSKPRTR